MSRLNTFLYKEIGSNSPKQGPCYITDFMHNEMRSANLCVQLGKMPTMHCSACPWDTETSINLWLASLFEDGFTPVKVKEYKDVTFG